MCGEKEEEAAAKNEAAVKRASFSLQDSVGLTECRSCGRLASLVAR